MSSSERRAVVLSLLALGACGFTPVYGPGGAAAGLWGKIEHDEPRNRDGFLLVRRFEERLGVPSAPRYRLSTGVRRRTERVAVTSEGVAQRYQVIGDALYTLYDRETGQPVARGEVAGFVSYSALRTTVATRAAENDATERLMVVLADQIVARLQATAPEWAA